MKHPLAPRSIKSCLSTTSLLLLLAAGCSTPEQISVKEEEDSDVTQMKVLQYTKADKLNGTDYMLWNEDDAVKVGDTEQEALASSGKPSKSFRIRSLPDRFGDEFSAGGWEKGDDLFACVLYREATVLAMYTREKVKDEDVDKALSLYQDKYGNASNAIDSGNRIQFHFWYTDDRMLMISTAVDVNDVKSLTVAIGVTQVMKHVGMDPDTARADIQSALQSLTEQNAAQ